jgi:hypothetical protein
MKFTKIDITKGTYIRDFYVFPTVFHHNGDEFYHSIELAWLKWYIGIVW